MRSLRGIYLIPFLVAPIGFLHGIALLYYACIAVLLSATIFVLWDKTVKRFGVYPHSISNMLLP